jgi:hypothetical protein
MEITFRAESFQPGRRSFLGQAVFCLGGVAAGATLPVSLLQAGPACLATDLCGDWQLDDICSSYPPYSFRRDAGHARDAQYPEALVDPLDALFAT